MSKHAAQPAMSKAVLALFSSFSIMFASLLPTRAEAILRRIIALMDSILSRIRGVETFMGLDLVLFLLERSGSHREQMANLKKRLLGLM